jgi:glutathione peroxidase
MPKITPLTLGIAWLLCGAALFAASSVYDFTLPSIDGSEASLGQYKGKVLLLVNVASKCGYTPQYSGLESLYEKYKDQGLVVIGFPANNFGAQEPGTNEEIKSFCTRTYHVSFPMYAKVSVKGGDKTPLYHYLTEEANPSTKGEIGWNFTKFLVDRNGKVIARFDSKITPDDPGLVGAVEKALNQ